MIPRVLVPTFNAYYWLLRPFAYLFNTYWSAQQPVVIGGYEPLPFDLPPNFTFHSIAPTSYPKEKWLQGVREFFAAMPDTHFVLALEDYWLIRSINHDAIRTLTEYMELHDDVLRIDLTTDRLYAGGIPMPHEHADEMYGHYDLIPSNVNNYHLSTQLGIWNRAHLLRFIKNYLSAGKSGEPWHFEVEGTTRLRDEFPEFKVLGTRQFPCRYTIGIKQGDDKVNVRGIPKEHLDRMVDLGYFEGHEIGRD